MYKNLFSIEYEITIPKNFNNKIKFFEDLWKFSKKTTSKLCNQSYIFDKDFEYLKETKNDEDIITINCECGSFLEYTYKYKPIDRIENAIVVTHEYDIGRKKQKNIICAEIKFQRWKLNKKNIKLNKKLMLLLSKYDLGAGEYQGIHINLDTQSFFPYIREIVQKFEDKFDYNEEYRKKIQLPEVLEINELNLKSTFDFINYDIGERVEIRAFDFNKEGIRKNNKFLKSILNITKKGQKKYSLRAYISNDYPILLKTTNLTESDENIKIFSSFKELKERYKGGKFITYTLFSANFEIYDKIF